MSGVIPTLIGAPMLKTFAIHAAILSALASYAPVHAQRISLVDRAAQVRAAETAFAKSMADRDHAAFTALLADDTVVRRVSAL